MCGRYGRRADKQRIAEAMQMNPNNFLEDDLPPSYNVAPHTYQLIVRLSRDSGERELALPCWGLVPFWSRDGKAGFSSINARAARACRTGHIGSHHFTPRFLLGVSILMEIPIFMVVLSCALPYRANHWGQYHCGNDGTVVLLTITYIAPLKNRTPTNPHDWLSGSIEIACTSLIVWYSWRWSRERSDS
jgi:hypothetical protein